MDQNEYWDNVDVLAINDGDVETKNDQEDESGYKKFNVKSYIPKRSNEKILKYGYIAGGVIIVVLLLIFIIAISLKKASINKSNDKSFKYFPRGLILNNNDSFWGYDKKTRTFTPLFKVKNPVETFELIGRTNIVMSGINTSKIISVSSKQLNLTYPKIDFSFEEARLKPRGMAVDFITENLYIVDDVLGVLVVINIKTKNYNILLSDLDKPHQIVLDSAEGLMFICQLSDSILKADMDGNSLTKIIPNTEIAAITLDRKSKRIYWVQDFINIESSDYNGNDRKLFLGDSVKIVSLAVFDNYFFWLWPDYGRVNATLWSCRLKNDTCEEHVMHTLDHLRDVKNMKISIEKDEEISNACKVNNGDCQHLCLIIPNGGRNCACNLGWQLNPDRKTCREIVDFILYTLDDTIRGRIIDNSKTSLVDVFWPTKYTITSVKMKGTIDFEYDLHNDDFYFSDDTHIYKIKLKSQSNQEVVLVSDISYVIEDLAYDWLTGNMYYSDRSSYSSRYHYLMMFNVKLGSEYKMMIANFRFDNLFGLQACPYALAIDPIKGNLFFTAGENDQRIIQRTSMNGTKLSKITGIPFVHEHRLIAIDYDKDKLYWIFDTDISITKIKYTDLDGSNEKMIIIDSMSRARTIFVYNQWLFLSNDTSIWRVNKETGHGLVRIFPVSEPNQQSPKIAGVRVISLGIQSTKNINNPCAVNNGDCERFCFAFPKKTCA